MQHIPVLPFHATQTQLPAQLAADSALRVAAEKLEATFLAEMLKSAGLESQGGSFGGGIGEEQFTSFLRTAQAERMVAAGGIGLAETIFHAMQARANGQ